MKRDVYMKGICLLLCVATVIGVSAKRKISGSVHDEEGYPLPGAIVKVEEDKTIGAITDANGNYEISIPDDGTYTLHVTYIGYVSEIAVPSSDSEQKIDFELIEDAIGLETIVVTGTRTPKLLKDAPIITRVISEDDIKKVDATHIGDLLQSELPGIEFSYAMNQQVNLNMQGFGGTSVLFLVDGERLAGETMDNIDYNRLNLDNVGRIEIVKGAASSLYGSNAVGGVINLISKESTEPWTANVNAHVGANKEQRYGGSFSFNLGKVYNVINVQHTFVDPVELDRDGDYSVIYGNKTWNFKERLVYTPMEGLKFSARAGYFFRERSNSDSEKNRYRDFNAGLKGDYDITPNDDLEVAYSFDQYDKSDFYPLTSRDIRDYSNVQHIVRAAYSHIFSYGQTLTAGGDYMRDYLMSYQFEDNGAHKQYTADVFLQYDWNVTDKLNLIAGARYDYYSKADLNHVSPKISAMYKINRVTLRGSYSGGFRAPTLKEMFMNFDMASIFMIYGNSSLKAETSHNFQLSGEYTKGRYNATLSGYYNLVDNRISTTWDQELNGMLYTNINKMDIMGLELNLAAKYAWGLGARVSYCYTYEHMRNSNDAYQTYTASSRPHTATLRVDYDKQLCTNYGFNVAFSGRILSSVTTDEYTSYTSGETEEVNYCAYSIWKLQLSQRIMQGISLTATIDNLFNYIPDYYYNNSPTTTGTTFSLSLSVDIDHFFK